MLQNNMKLFYEYLTIINKNIEIEKLLQINSLNIRQIPVRIYRVFLFSNHLFQEIISLLFLVVFNSYQRGIKTY